jgi:hypothetical protein
MKVDMDHHCPHVSSATSTLQTNPLEIVAIVCPTADVISIERHEIIVTWMSVGRD